MCSFFWFKYYPMGNKLAYTVCIYVTACYIINVSNSTYTHFLKKEINMSKLNDTTLYEKSVIHLDNGRKRIQFRAIPQREEPKGKKKRSKTIHICDID